MTSNSLTITGLIITFLLLVLVMWISNIKDREFRYHQFLVAIAAPIYASLVFFIYIMDFFPYSAWTSSSSKISLEASMGDIWKESVPHFVFFIIAILFFLLIKRGLIWLATNNKNSNKPPAITYGIYERKEKRILLKNSYYYPLKFMLASAILFSTVFCLSFFSYHLSVAFPAYVLLLIFIFLEFYWFFNGKSALNKIVAPVKKIKNIDFRPLWEEYKNTWSENLSIAFTKKSQFTNWQPSKIEGEMLVKNYKKNELFQNLQHHIVDLLNKGKKTIIFIPDTYMPDTKLEDSVKFKIIKDILFGSDYTSQFLSTDIMSLKMEASIYITSIDNFLLEAVNIEEDYELHRWFKNLRLVLYFGYDKTLIESPESSVSASSIIKYLSENPEDLTSIVFAEDREAQQASWKSNLKTNPQKDREIKINDSESENTYYLGWRAEKHFEAGLFNNYANRYVGPLVSLLPLPYAHGINQVDIKFNNSPFYENIENAIAERGDWRDRFKELKLRNEEGIKEYIIKHDYNLSIDHTQDKVSIINDIYYNAPFLFKYYNEFGKKNHLINIVSPPHILRSYFDDNFEYFSKNPIKPLSYMLIPGDRFTLALSLLEKLVKCKLTIKELAQDFSEIKYDDRIVIKQLRQLFKEAYKDFDIISTSSLIVTNSEEGLLFSLKTDIKDQIELFKKVEFVDTTNNIVYEKNKNLLFQKYLKGQVHTFNEKVYTIRSINNIGKDIVVKLENTESKQDFSYTEQRIIHLDNQSNWKKIESKYPTNEYSLNIYSKKFVVTTASYFELNDGNSLAKGRYTVHRTDDIKDRVYTNGRICKISFANFNTIPSFWKANLTLRIIFEEVLKVLYPDSFHYLIVRCFGKPHYSVDNILAKYYLLDNTLESDDYTQSGIYIFEDSVFDMGHLKSILENIDYIFKIIDDYLSYLTEKIQNQNFPNHGLNDLSFGHKDFFLSYELKNIINLSDFPDPIDIPAAKNLTSKCLRVHNDVTYDRLGQAIPSGPVKQPFFGTCASCEKPNCKEGKAELLDDGRIICNDCLKKNKRSQSANDILINQAKDYFETYQTLPKINSILFTNLKKIVPVHEIQQTRFPHASIKIIKSSSGYDVFVENYRNSLETYIALIHAFTHIWQLENIESEQLNTKRLLMDGHAMMLMEGFLENENYSTFSQKNKKELLRKIRTFRANYFSNAQHQLKQLVDEANNEVFFYLIMTYGSGVNVTEMEIVDY